jgi:hypothetical protein
VRWPRENCEPARAVKIKIIWIVSSRLGVYKKTKRSIILFSISKYLMPDSKIIKILFFYTRLTYNSMILIEAGGSIIFPWLFCYFLCQDKKFGYNKTNNHFMDVLFGTQKKYKKHFFSKLFQRFHVLKADDGKLGEVPTLRLTSTSLSNRRSGDGLSKVRSA